jgi:hypothetical protein
MPNPLIQFWRKFDVKKPPFAHHDDLPVLLQNDRWLKNDDPVDFDTFIASSRFNPEDIRLHLSLLPVPYVGDLNQAEIVVFLLNPGFSYSDYWAETKISGFRTRLEGNLQQSFEGVEFHSCTLTLNFVGTQGSSGGRKSYAASSQKSQSKSLTAATSRHCATCRGGSLA